MKGTFEIHTHAKNIKYIATAQLYASESSDRFTKIAELAAEILKINDEIIKEAKEVYWAARTEATDE